MPRCPTRRRSSAARVHPLEPPWTARDPGSSPRAVDTARRPVPVTGTSLWLLPHPPGARASGPFGAQRQRGPRRGFVRRLGGQLPSARPLRDSRGGRGHPPASLPAREWRPLTTGTWGPRCWPRVGSTSGTGRRLSLLSASVCTQGNPYPGTPPGRGGEARAGQEITRAPGASGDRRARPGPAWRAGQEPWRAEGRERRSPSRRP